MVKIPIEEQLKKLEQQQAALAQKKAKIKKQIAKQERNARTKRLIEIGATIEAALEQEIPKEKLPALAATIKQDHHKYDIINAINAQENEQ